MSASPSSTTDFHAWVGASGAPVADELGPAAALSPEQVTSALRIARRGEIYDLDIGRWHAMPVPSSEAPMQVMTHRSPQGLAVQGDSKAYTGPDGKVGWVGDLLIGPSHAGTHIDALSHITVGPDHAWFGGHRASEWLGDFGPLRADAAAIPPIVTRGVLLDIPAVVGQPTLPADHVVTPADIAAAEAAQGVEVRAGDAVLVRTGFLRLLENGGQMGDPRSGVGIAAARELADRGAVLVGADNPGVEPYPWDSSEDDVPLPVHRHLLAERGVHLLEMVYLDALAHDRVYEFCFVCSAPKIAGATGSWTRPLAIV